MIPYSSKIGEWASSFFGPKRSFLDGVLELSKILKNEVEFDGGVTEINTSVEEFFEIKKGVCQDFAHLVIAAIRSQDLPVRYVSGYILTFPGESVKTPECENQGNDRSGDGGVEFSPFGHLSHLVTCSEVSVTFCSHEDDDDMKESNQ
ncbi:MAG: transglutaminase family protein [Opitutales bacterium]|nr:transglutaminase family protein [Opitutales bacterium]